MRRVVHIVTGLFLLVAVGFTYFCGNAQAVIVLDEPLQGSTTGTRSGGAFVAGGWQVTTSTDTIYWHLNTVVPYGAAEHIPLLHFECCYYQAIEYAIARGLKVFEGGAQGEHKIFRGLLPVEAPSTHWLAHARFAHAVEDFLQREGAGITRYVDELREHSPFRKPQEEK